MRLEVENRARYDFNQYLKKLGRDDEEFFRLANKSVCFEASGQRDVTRCVFSRLLACCQVLAIR